MKTLSRCGLIVLLATGMLRAETHFVEAEKFETDSNGWRVMHASTASATNVLGGASGDVKGVARSKATITEGGNFRIWVRYLTLEGIRGPFNLTVSAGGERIAARDFDLAPLAGASDWDCSWEQFDATLPAGEIMLELGKYEQKNCNGYVRKIDCILLTSDLELKPDHRDYGPQSYLRVTIGDIYDKPVYIHVFADHFRSPWYGHYHLSKGGAGNGLGPARTNLLQAGEQTPWCNITRMLYQDSGAILNMTVRHSYGSRPGRMKAVFDFATAPDEAAIVRTMEVEAQPNGLVVAMPPDLGTPENRARLGRDLDFAMRTGDLADNYPWPTAGRKPSRFPFFVAAGIGGYGTPPDQAVIDRERKTLDYFGFSNWTMTEMHAGTWRAASNSYCRPVISAITNAASLRAGELAEKGRSAADVVYCMLMDEPTGQSLEFMAQDGAYQMAFRKWLQGKGLTPADLLLTDWDAVRTVTEGERDSLPALYYYSQRFRTQALGDFMAIQRRALKDACGGSIPVNVNFSDGATYHANFYSQGVDYFELLVDPDGQNAIWGEDWANGSSSYQCGAYNVDLMRAAARDHGQVIGHYLIAHAGRRPLDIKLKAAGNAARGVKMMKSFSYGVYWGSHEGGPSWRSHVWQNRPQIWGAHAELLREIGAVEEMLLPAMPAPAEVAILYSSSSDIWAIGQNLAYGFDRMHTWMALAHGQIPVDFVSEDQAGAGQLDGYRVCYLSGPNLTRAAAARLADWVRAGGTLVATAAAGTRDEYNRPMTVIGDILPATRGEAATPQRFYSSGHYISTLKPQDRVTLLEGGVQIDALSVLQPLVPRAEALIVATNSAGGAAWVGGRSGDGTVHALGFLPALDYIRQAQLARQALVSRAKKAREDEAAIDGPDASRDEAPVALAVAEDDRARLEASANPWDYPEALRKALLAPARAAGIDPPVVCSVAQIDAVYMTCPEGIVIPLANYTLHPLDKVEFAVRIGSRVRSVDSVYHGRLGFKQNKPGKGWITFLLPLESTDYITIRLAR